MNDVNDTWIPDVFTVFPFQGRLSNYVQLVQINYELVSVAKHYINFYNLGSTFSFATSVCHAVQRE